MEDQSQRDILFKLQLDVDLLNKNAEEASQQLQNLREKQQGLNKDSLEYRTIAADIKTYSAQLKASADALSINNRLQSTGVQGIIQTRDALKAATTELYANEQAYGAASEQANKSRGTVQALTASMQTQYSVIGKTTMNVGNYSGKIITLSKGIGGVTGLLEIMARTMGLDETAVSALGAAHGVLIKGSRDLHHITQLGTEGKVENTAATVGQTVVTEEATVAQEGLNIAMEANPIGIILAAIGAVLALGAAVAGYIYESDVATKSEELRAKAIDGTIIKNEELRKAYNEHIDTLASVAREYDVMSGKINEAEAKLGDMKDKNKEAVENIKNETEAKLNDTNKLWNQFKLGVVAAIAGEGVAQKMAMDERIKIIKEGGEKIQAEDLKLADEKLKEQEKSDEEIVKQMEETSKKMDEEEKKRTEKAKQEYLKRIQDAAHAFAEYYKVLLKSVTDELALDLKKEKDTIDSDNKAQAKRVEMFTKSQLELQKLTQTEDKIGYENKIKSIEAEKQLRLKQITEDESLFYTDNKKTIESQKAFDKERLDIEKLYADKSRQIKGELAKDELNLAEGLVNDLKVAGGKNSAIQKQIALADIAINEAKSIAALMYSTTANPLNATTFGTAGIIEFAAGLGNLMANVARAIQLVNSSPGSFGAGGLVPIAEKGIILGGHSHAMGGTQISVDGKPVAIAEEGELLAIVNKKSTAVLQNLSRLNSMNGNGISFMERGGIIPHFQSGGAMPLSNLSEPIANRYSQMNMMLKYMKMLPAPVVGVRDITDAQNTQNVIVQGATI